MIPPVRRFLVHEGAQVIPITDHDRPYMRDFRHAREFRYQFRHLLQQLPASSQVVGVVRVVGIGIIWIKRRESSQVPDNGVAAGAAFAASEPADDTIYRLNLL